MTEGEATVTYTGEASIEIKLHAFQAAVRVNSRPAWNLRASCRGEHGYARHAGDLPPGPRNTVCVSKDETAKCVLRPRSRRPRARGPSALINVSTPRCPQPGFRERPPRPGSERQRPSHGRLWGCVLCWGNNGRNDASYYTAISTADRCPLAGMEEP